MKNRAVRAGAFFALWVLAGCEIGVEDAQRQPEAQAAGRGTVVTGGLHFVRGYDEGYRQAVEQGKPMLVFFTAPWCHFCHQMAEDAFTHPQVVSLSQRFVCILVDADAEPLVCRQFQVMGYPTVQFLSPRGVPLERIVGKKPGHQLMMAMQAALQNVARREVTAEDAQTGSILRSKKSRAE
jgi:thioredoxin-like negative regulator of GroEL